MKRASTKRSTKKLGRPATGQDPVTAIRLSNELIANVSAWGARRGITSRSEALRQLVLLGLSTEPARKPKKGIADTRDARRSQSKRLAGDAMDREMKHSGVSDDEKDERKRRLMKMPGELSTDPTRKAKKGAPANTRSERGRARKRFDNQKGDRS